MKTNKKESMQKMMDKEVTLTIFEYILAQYRLKQGLRKFGKLEEQATEKEFEQIYRMDALHPLDPKQFSEEEKKNVIASSFFLPREEMEL